MVVYINEPPMTDIIEDVVANIPACAKTRGKAAPVTRMMEVRNLEKS